MEFSVAVIWAYYTLLTASTFGYVLDRSSNMELQSTNIKEIFDSTHAGDLTKLQPTNGQNGTGSYAVEAEELHTGGYEDNSKDFFGMEEGTNDEELILVERPRRDSCLEPSSEQLEAMLLSKVKAVNDGTPDETIPGSNGINKEECNNRRNEPVEINTALNRRAICPWENKMNIDNERYPSKIWYAECLCGDCNNHGGQCTPSMHPRYVLYRGDCVNGTYQYNLGMVDVAVACVCSRSSNS